MSTVNKSLIIEVVQVMLLAAFVFFGIRVLFDNYRVLGSSMEPSLSDGQYLVINKAVYLRSSWLEKLNPFRNPGDGHYVFHPPSRGDIVIIQPPVASVYPFIKRVIGVPGDVVEVRQGRVYVNGYVLNEPYASGTTRRDFPRQVVPPGSIFVLGDNRYNSEDSTYFGMVPEKNVIGKAWVRYWPPSEWSLAPNASLAGPSSP